MSIKYDQARMRLKKIIIVGFKSFADKTILNFDSGITCIVGPNGCGKSNIADAFRWVLGEQSAKSMRGAKMPDVIFAGTSQRKPLNYAEVSLTFSEVRGFLPIDYEEMTITRRLHRSGDSEYLLNSNPVRLKDLQTLFIGSGVGKNAFSIFEQGKLDQVISFSPLERRYIFEEAAGILRFLESKKEALKKLEHANLNLSRVQDIQREVEKNINALEKQAQIAKSYKEQKNQLEQLEKNSYMLRWQNSEKKLKDFQGKKNDNQQKLDICQSEIAEIRKQVYIAKRAKQGAEKALLAHNEKLMSFRNQQEILLHDCQTLQQNAQEFQLKEKKLRNELENLHLARENRFKIINELNHKKDQLELEWGEAESKWKNQQNRVKTHEKELERLRRESAVKHQIYIKLVQQNSQGESELKQTEIRIENLKEQQKRLESHIHQLKLDGKQLSQNYSEKKQNLQQISDLVETHKDRLDQYEEDIKIVVQNTEDKQKESDALRRRMMEEKARQKMILRMRDEHEGFSAGSKILLQESQNRESRIYQTLRPFYEYFKPEEEFVEAISVVLRTYAQTLVVEKECELKQILSFAEEMGLQDYSLLCLEWLQKVKKESLMAKDSLMKKVALNFLAQYFLKDIGLASTCEEGVAAWMEGKCEEGWNLTGTFIDHKGVIFKVKPNENQVFIRESELNLLEEEIKNKEEQILAYEKNLIQLQHKRTHLQLERTELDKILRRDEMKLVEVNFNLQHILSDQEKNKTDLEKSEKELIAQKINLDSLKQSFCALEKQYSQIKQELLHVQQEKEFLDQELGKIESSWRIQTQDQKAKGTYYQELSDQLRQLHHQLNLLEIKEQEHDNIVLRITNELDELAEKKEQTNQKEKESYHRLNLLEKQMEEASKEQQERISQVAILNEQCDQLDRQLDMRHNDLKQIENDMTQIYIQITQQETLSQAIVTELSERFQLSIEDILELPLPLKSLDQNERQIRQLRQALQDIGDVNLAAIEDLEKQQVRNAFLKQQIEDMQQSKGELLAIIEKLNVESHKLFKETFELIRINFKKNFQILFIGGDADLQFTESQDILEAGIEISAKPPGKQMRSISLLSGGEKCLTALALLFAIFEVKPSPFCILDEIDAPLDDTNVERFVNVVKHFTDRCQFLIITHNKRTMAIGDVLFGVSMEEKGISKILSLEFAHRETPEASLIS